MTDARREQAQRWRLVLGEGADDSLGNCLDAEGLERDACLGFLYDREHQSRQNVRQRTGERKGGLGASALTTPDWINHVHRLFPRSTIERLEKDALERYELKEMVTNPEILARAKPNATLLKAVLQTKHLMDRRVLKMAQQLVAQVVRELMEKLAREVRNPFLGAIDRRRRSHLRIAKNFDIRSTLRHNLKHYDPARRRVVVETPFFYSRQRRQTENWQVIIVVDQSGSMLDSVIHSAVTASIFWDLPGIQPHLVLFDTAVVDVTAQCQDPVETLMKVQLGGGTDIGNALAYAAGLVNNPGRTIVVLITDFYEGASPQQLVRVARQLVESGVTLLGLAALDAGAEPDYDRALAARLVGLGAHVGAMTPGELAAWVAEKVR